jgi:hypothetical protein
MSPVWYVRCVVRAFILAALGMLGCGRFGFGEMPPAGDAGPIDAPPVPASICKVDRFPLTSAPTIADLAITGTSEGYAAIWVDPTGATQAHGIVLGPNHQVKTSLALPDLKDTRLGGITDVGQKLVLSAGDRVSQTTWILARDLSAAASESTLTASVMAHGPYPSDTNQSPRVFVAVTGKTRCS